MLDIPIAWSMFIAGSLLVHLAMLLTRRRKPTSPRRVGKYSQPKGDPR